MRWVYILRCRGGFFYVGETERLFRRFWEHNDGVGGLNTSVYPPEKLVAIYQVNRLGKFFDYIQKVNDNNYNLGYNIYFERGGILENFNNVENGNHYDSRRVENIITEKMMLSNIPNWQRIRGGKYVRFDINYNFPEENAFIRNLPNCNCGLPCDVKKNEREDYLYFRCAKKNIWVGLRDLFETEQEACNYFERYTSDLRYKIEYDNRMRRIEELRNVSDWLENVAGGQYEHCIGGCGKEFDEDYTVRYRNNIRSYAINLCFDCFLNENIYNELRDRYTDVWE